MTINIHPSAVENYNKKADDLLDLVDEFPPDNVQQEGFSSELHIAASLTDKDIIGDIEVATSDYRGNTIARFFHFNGKKYGLSEENYKKLKDVAERIQLLPGIRNKLSCSFVEKNLFSWLCNRYKKIETSQFYLEFLTNETRDIVKQTTSWVPIANLEVQSAFPISKSKIIPISKEVMDNWEKNMGALAGENKEKVIEYFRQKRKAYQGLAAVVTTIEAEPEYAFDYALEEAQKITSVLGIFSSATLMPDIKCLSNIKGSENMSQATIFFESSNGHLSTTTSRILDKASMKYWRLSQKEIIEIRKVGLDKISSLLTTEPLKGFQESVLNAIFLYSKSAFTSDPVEKVVYILSSLESILLKNENESIQQNLSERIAIFTAHGLEERKSIIKIIKSIYGVRSRYLHHGHTSLELKLIADFMLKVWLFYMQLLENIDRFSTQEEFVNAIDDQKLS